MFHQSAIARRCANEVRDTNVAAALAGLYLLGETVSAIGAISGKDEVAAGVALGRGPSAGLCTGEEPLLRCIENLTTRSFWIIEAYPELMPDDERTTHEANLRGDFPAED